MSESKQDPPHTWQTGPPEFPPSIGIKGPDAHDELARWLNILDRRVSWPNPYNSLGTFHLYQLIDSGLINVSPGAIPSGFGYAADANKELHVKEAVGRKWTISRYQLEQSECEALAEELGNHHSAYFGGGYDKGKKMSEALAREFLGPEPHFRYGIVGVPFKDHKLTPKYLPKRPEDREFRKESNFWVIQFQQWPEWYEANDSRGSKVMEFETNRMCTTNKAHALRWLHMTLESGVEVVEYTFQDAGQFLAFIKEANKNKQWFGKKTEFVQLEGGKVDGGPIPGYSGESDNFEGHHRFKMDKDYKFQGDRISVETVEARLPEIERFRQELERLRQESERLKDAHWDAILGRRP